MRYTTDARRYAKPTYETDTRANVKNNMINTTWRTTWMVLITLVRSILFFE